MMLTKLQARAHRLACLQYDRSSVSRLSDEMLRWAVAQAAAGNHDGERCAWPYRDPRSGVIVAGPLPVMLQAVAEEVVRRASYAPGQRVPPVLHEPRRLLVGPMLRAERPKRAVMRIGPKSGRVPAPSTT